MSVVAKTTTAPSSFKALTWYTRTSAPCCALRQSYYPPLAARYSREKEPFLFRQLYGLLDCSDDVAHGLSLGRIIRFGSQAAANSSRFFELGVKFVHGSSQREADRAKGFYHILCTSRINVC